MLNGTLVLGSSFVLLWEMAMLFFSVLLRRFEPALGTTTVNS